MTRATLKSVRTQPGGATAVVGTEGVALIDAPVDHPLVVAVADALGSGGGFSELLAALAAHGLDSLPPLGAVFGADRGIRAISRGAVRLGVVAAAPLDPSMLSGTTLVTWREVAIPAARTWELFLADEGPASSPDAGVPSEPGVAPAGRITGEVGSEPVEPVPVEPAPEEPVEPGPVEPGLMEPTPVEPVDPWGPPEVTAPSHIVTPPPGGPAVASEWASASTQEQAPGAGDRPSVPQQFCDLGHPNPPEAESCRECAGPISDTTLFDLPRPDLGRLVFDSGRSVGLDRPVVIGRNPPEGLVVDGEPATAFRVPDPEAVLSRQHLEVRLQGWDVVLVDKKSRNSTTITRPGDPPERLLPAVPTEIPLGTRVLLADSAEFTYQAP